MADDPTHGDLSLVIPAYNEARRLPATLEAIRGFQSGFPGRIEVIVVDDGSTDATIAVVRAAAASMPGLRVIPRPHRGKGAAVRAGMLAARHPWVILCDADLSMPVDQLYRLIGALQRGAQIAVGSRELPDSCRYREPWRRHLMGRVFNGLVRLLVVGGLADTQCGFKGFRRAAARDLFAIQRIEGFSFDAEILFLARRRGYRIEEVPIDWYFDADSRVRPTADTLRMTADLLRIRYHHRRGVYRDRLRTAPSAEPVREANDSGAPVAG